ncbi:PspA/IM30 family protein [Sulfoacidibacillus thermotolerans]|uniref:Phage shock protein A n=1 Tax=Sulfoacidibacillus thermotolerans TaxID=1765684 RepID=A0A2U3DCA4_SULT2|nr:PspA/IM30 family protein [Sulfoacidibacillus thermotolerans]PWI58892.1 phage shock protein A [Sulfoacidibacillus thermotolerans]
MALFKRIRDITAATVNDLLDKAEDPVKMVNQFLRDMEDDIRDAQTAVAKQIAVEKRFLEQRDEALDLVNKRQEQAVKALELGHEDLARKALLDKKEQQEKADQLSAEYEKAKALSENLKAKLDEMKTEYQKMKSKRELLVARADAAKVQKQVNDALGSFSSDSAARGFSRMEERVNQMEAQAQASEELRRGKPSLDDELKQLGDRDVEDELAALKAKLAQKADA